MHFEEARNGAGSQVAPVNDLTIVVEIFDPTTRSRRLRITFVFFLKTNVMIAPCSLLLAPCSFPLAPFPLLLAPFPLLLSPCSLPLAPCSLLSRRPVSTLIQNHLRII